MKVNEMLENIGFNVGTLDDITGKSINPTFNNRQIINKANLILKDYAIKTKGIQDIWSFPLNTNVPFIAAPSLALRSEAYFGILVYSNTTIFPADMRGLQDVYANFRVAPIQGITNWLMPWSAGKDQYLSAFPMKNISAFTTTLNGALTATATTITVASTASFVKNNGRITIGTEKILYGYTDATHFYNCVRGVEMTTAASHLTLATVTENNVVLFYSRLPVKIVVTDNDYIPPEVLDRELEIVEDHLMGIIKLITYELLIKKDPERATIYKIDGDELFKQYAMDIRRGYYRGRQGTNIRSPHSMNESGTAYGSAIIY